MEGSVRPLKPGWHQDLKPSMSGLVQPIKPSDPSIREIPPRSLIHPRFAGASIKIGEAEFVPAPWPSVSRREHAIDRYDEGLLYSEYKVRKRQFFQVGRVFSMVWPEPASEHVKSAIDRKVVVGRYGEPIYVKIKRFIVVRESVRHCTALLIAKYSGQGVAKAGVTKSDHSIIYTGKTPPQPLPEEEPGTGEFGMQPVPIRVDMDNNTEKLDSRPESITARSVLFSMIRRSGALGWLMVIRKTLY